MATTQETPASQPSTDGTPNEPTPEQLGIEPNAPETPQKEGDASEVNDSPKDTKAVAELDPTSPTVQAQTGPEVVAPIQPEEPSASDVASAIGMNKEPAIAVGGATRKTTHTISAGDLNAHPELSKQGLSLNDEIAYGSAWVYKYPTADRSNIVTEPFPRDVSGGRL